MRGNGIGVAGEISPGAGPATTHLGKPPRVLGRYAKYIEPGIGYLPAADRVEWGLRYRDTSRPEFFVV